MQSEIHARSPVWKELWANLADYTEAAWLRRALAGQWEATAAPDTLHLVCRPNFDVYIGTAGLYRQRLGNLKRDGVAKTLAGVTELKPTADDQLFYQRERFPTIATLAQSVGNPDGESVYFEASSVRYLWLDRFFSKRQAKE